MKPNDKAFEAAIKTYNIHSDYDAESVSLRLAVDAAFVAQFPPSEDYAGLVKWLRDKAESLSEIYPPEAEAADALEVVLAERDAAKRSAYEDAARFIEENVFNYSSGDQNYWSHRKGDNTHGLEYAREFRKKAAAIRSGK